MLDPAPDPVLDALVAVAARTSGSAVGLWLRNGPDWLMSAPSHRVEIPAWGDTATVAPVMLAGLRVGEVRGPRSSADLLANVADEAARHLEQRWQAARRGAAGQPVGVLVADEELRIAYASHELDQLANGESASWVGRPVLDLVGTGDRTLVETLLTGFVHGRGRAVAISIDLELTAHDAASYEVTALNRVEDPDVGAYAFVITPTDLGDHDHSLLGDQNRVMSRLAHGRPLDETLEQVVEVIERRVHGGRCCVMLLDETTGHLEPAVAPNLSMASLDSLRGIPIGPGEPGGGASVHFGMPQYWNDLRSTSAWIGRREALVDAGVRTCWSMPIVSIRSQLPLGSLDVYLPDAGEPTNAVSQQLILLARYIALAIDQDQRERELRYDATHDPLTALPNRLLFAERLEEAAAVGHLAVLFIDLDRFKLVNDTLGHDFGDELLCAVAERLAKAAPAPATVGRFGGDEFTVLLPGVDLMTDAITEAERLLSSLGEPYRVRGQPIALRASAGVAVSARPLSDPHSLVRHADAALHHAKDRGRGHVEAFDERILDAAAERLRIERALIDALDAGRIQVEFQPSVRMHDGAVVGVEALARCHTGYGEAISPLDFIPVAEEAGLVPRLFDVVLTESCSAAMRWNRGRDDPIVVWVNVSPQQLGSPELIDQIGRVFELTGVDPRTVGFEVTEQGILVDPADARDRLSALVALGSRTALDDFGTGHSSLTHLQELPVDTVKLDRSFVIRAETDPRSTAIIESVVRMAEAMDLDCVAEGVETKQDFDVVAALGCRIAQGYFISRPQPADDLTKWMVAQPHPDSLP